DDMIRCNDEGSLESQDNPDWIDCDPRGFEYAGEEANENSVRVTIQLLDADESVLLSNEIVSLPSDPDALIQPNGPDCEPTCVERRGQSAVGTTGWAPPHARRERLDRCVGARRERRGKQVQAGGEGPSPPAQLCPARPRPTG